MGHLDRITQEPAVWVARRASAVCGLRRHDRRSDCRRTEHRALLSDYPYLEREDIMQALRYAAWRSEEREVTLATA